MKLIPASIQDIEQVVCFEYAMLQEMVSYGGHSLADGRRVKEWLRECVKQDLQQADSLVLLAITEGKDAHPVGVVVACPMHIEEVFQPKKVLHIHAVYVTPERRREGIGHSLVEATLAWAREKGCVEVELNTLTNNPARHLYEHFGFHEFQVEMRYGLKSI